MPKRSSKDINETTFSIVQEVTQSASAEPKAKNPAVALGRLGGVKGGKARAASLSAKEGKRIAQKAASGKWKKYYSEHPKR